MRAAISEQRLSTSETQAVKLASEDVALAGLVDV
jgi:hypothetical protein